MNLPKFNVPGISMPGGGGSNSFTKQLGADIAREEAAAENLRRFKIVQGARDRAEQRDVARYGLDMENAQMRNQVAKMNMAEALKGQARQEALPQLLRDVPTEATQEVDERYRIVNENPNYTQAEKDIKIQNMNDKVINSFDAGEMNLNKISNPNQYKEQAAFKMLQEGYKPAEIDATLKTLTAPIEAGIAANQTSLKSGLDFADQMAKDELAKAKEGGGSSGFKPSSVEASKVFTKTLNEELDNVYGNQYETQQFKTKNGETDFSFDNNNKLVGNEPGRQAKFLSDLSKQKFTYKGSDGSTKERYLTKPEIELLVPTGYEGNFFNADQIDAEVVYKNAAKHINDVGASKYDKSLSTIHKNQAATRDALTKQYSRETGEDAINKILGVIKKKQ